jgi:hypothetical protein
LIPETTAIIFFRGKNDQPVIPSERAGVFGFRWRATRDLLLIVLGLRQGTASDKLKSPL